MKNPKNYRKKKKHREQDFELVLGIDDAGRGPLIGPMALAGVLINPETEKEFKTLGVRDSKLLGARKREDLASIIRKNQFLIMFALCTLMKLTEELNKA